MEIEFLLSILLNISYAKPTTNQNLTDSQNRIQNK